MPANFDLTDDELEILARDASTQMSPLQCVLVLRLIAEVKRRRGNICETCGRETAYTLCGVCDNDD